MNVNICYGINHIGVVYSILISCYAFIKYRHIKKNNEIFLQFGMVIIGMYICLLPAVGIIGCDFIIKHEVATFNKLLPVTCCFVFCWIFSSIILFAASNYYVKVEEDRVIIHSIWFSKFILYIDQIDKKKSFVVMANKTFLDTYYIFYYKGKYIRIAYEPFIHTMKIKKFVDFYVGITRRVITKKDEYKRFKKTHDIISVGILFINTKRIKE